jgi:hypothetical protein
LFNQAKLSVLRFGAGFACDLLSDVASMDTLIEREQTA